MRHARVHLPLLDLRTGDLLARRSIEPWKLLELPVELEAINADLSIPDMVGQGAGGTARGGPERSRALSKALRDEGEVERESQSRVT